MENEVYEYSKTSYALKSPSLRYIWAGYFLFIITSSFIGDTTILVASIRYRAIELHKALVIIIQHAAVCDLMVAVVICIPAASSLISGRQFFGDAFCRVTCFINYHVHTTSTFLICAMVICKLMIIKFPFRSRLMTRRRSHLICAFCWTTPILFLLPGLIIDVNDVHFSYRGYTCTYGRSAEIWRLFSPLTTLIFQVLPTSLVLFMTIHLVILAKKVAARARQGLKWQGVITIILTASVYCLSILPISIHYLGNSAMPKEGTEDSFFHTTFYRIAFSCVFLNTISNFYIYSLTVPSFRRFLISRMWLFVGLISGKRGTRFA